MTRIFRIGLGLVALGLGSRAGGIALADPGDFLIERVARTGDPVPEIEGATFEGFAYLPVIDNQGNVVFYGWFDDAGTERAAYFYGGPGCLEMFLEWKTMPPGYDDPEMIHQYCYLPVVAENGTIVVGISVGKTGQSPSTFIPSYYSGTPGSMELFLYDGGPAPDQPAGSTVLYDSYVVLVNATGKVGLLNHFVELVGDPPTLVTPICAGAPNDLKVIAQSGDEVPGIEGGATFLLGEVPAIGGYSFDDRGWAAFGALFEGLLVDSYNDFGFFAGTKDELHLVAREGSQAPGMDPGVVFDSFLWHDIRMNAAGEVAFVGCVDGPIMEGTDSGVWTGPWQAPTLVASLREGTQAPGAPDGQVIDFFQSATIDNSSRLLVQAYLSGPGVDATNDEGWWYGPADNIELLVRDGQQAPELPTGVVIDFNVVMDYLYSAMIASNDNGDLFMVTPLSGPGVDESNNAALYYRGPQATAWELALRTGDVLEGRVIAPAGIDSYAFYFDDGAHGSPRSLNEAGQVAAYVEFIDGSTGIYRISPLPVSLAKADADGDGDVDLIDFGRFQNCFASGACECLDDFDLDGNGAVDLLDYAVFQAAFTGPR